MLSCKCLFLGKCIILSPVFSHVRLYFSDTKEDITSIILVLKNCHLYTYYVMLGFQMRYYKGHISLPIIFQNIFWGILLIGSIMFFSNRTSNGIPGVQVSQSTAVHLFHLCSLREEKDNYFIK